MGGPTIHLLMVILQALAPILLPLLGVTAGSPAHLGASAGALALAGLTHAHHRRRLKAA